MDPKNTQNPAGEQTETLPAQEKVAGAGHSALALSAEQVYAQRIYETPLDGTAQTQGFVP